MIVLKNLKVFFYSILDLILPPRSDFEIVQKLNEDDILALPQATTVPKMDWVHPLFLYKDFRVKAIIWELKYRENTSPLKYISKILYEEIIALISDILLFQSDAEFLLVPIPISVNRRRERGYNQSEYMARAIREHDTEQILLYAPQWLEKIKETERQSHSQSKQERMKNLVGCFKADSRVEGKCIILIDDVVTTGSTLSEARSTLFSAGAKDVFAFTIAH